MFGIESVADDDRQATLDGRGHGLRMHDLGTEVCQFAGFVIAQFAELHGFGHHARIGGQHAIHVGPDMQFGGIEQRGEDRPGVVAAVASQGGQALGVVPRDEAGHHYAALRILCTPMRQALATDVPVHHHTQVAVLDHQHLACIQHRAVFAQRFQVIAEQACRTYFAQTLYAVQYFAGQLADDCQRGKDFSELVETLVQPFQRGSRRFTQQRHHGTAVPGTQFMPLVTPFAAAARSQSAQFDQCVGDALHGRDHGDLFVFVAGQQQAGDMAIAFGIGDGSTAELVHDGECVVAGLRCG